MSFLVDVLPRSVDDVRITVTLEAVDRLDALRLALAEVGLEGGWVGRASIEPASDGSLHVTAPDGERAFVVRPADGSTPAIREPDPDDGSAEERDDADEQLLDESRLELYFADEEDPGAPPPEAAPAVEPEELFPAERPGARASLCDTRELKREGAELPRDERASRVVASLCGLEDHVYDIQEAMEQVARTLLGPLGAEVACVLLVDRKGKAMGFAGLAGAAPERLSRYRYPKGLGLPWLAYDERRSLLMNGIDRDGALHREVLEKTGFRIRATVLAPIQSEGRTWGVVQAVRNAPEAPDFVEADVAVLEAAAARVGAYLALFGTYL